MAETGRACRETLVAMGMAALPVVALLLEQWHVAPQVDDAYITYRYAANWLDGQGLVFNPGERVEGFTSPLFTAGIALGMAAGLPAPLAGHVLGLLGAVAAMGATAALARALAPGLPGWVAGCAPWLLWISPAFVRWSTSGLETSLFAAAVTASLAAAAAGRIGALTTASAVATLARPEGALVAAIAFGAGWLRGARRTRWVQGAALYAACMLLLVGARLAYYGDVVPNTFHAKVGGVSPSFGLAYLWGFLSGGVVWLLPPAAWAALRLPAARPAAYLVLLHGLYVVAIGGDLLGESRFLVPLLPVCAALAVVGAATAREGGRATAAVAAACVIAAGVWLAWGPGPPGEGSRRARVLDAARRSDRFFEAAAERRAAVLRERGESRALVATGAIGAFGLRSGLPVIDILGLTDAHIARAPLVEEGVRWPGHLRSDAGYVLSREPDYLLIPRRDTPGAGRLRAVADLWSRPELESDYVWDDALRGYRRIRQETPQP